MFHIKPSTWVKNRLDTLVDVSKMSDEDQSEWKNWMMFAFHEGWVNGSNCTALFSVIFFSAYTILFWPN